MRRTTFISLFTIVLSWLSALSVLSQDSLSIDQLLPLTFAFDIENGALTGEGGAFLRREMANAQFTMLGEYHGSKRISEFTEAIIPILDRAGYKTLVAEVGPITGQILDTLNADVHTALREIYANYAVIEDDGYVNTPFPFFEYVEDANFLREVKRRDWRIHGIDQEYYFCHHMLIDLMYANLGAETQRRLSGLYRELIDSLDAYVQSDLEGDRDLAVSLESSAVYRDFVSTAATTEANEAIRDALDASNHMYWLYAQKQWFENNSTRIRYMKEQLATQLKGAGFNWAEDKLLIKMGGYHLSKGFSPLGLYEVGSTLNELAEIHGNTALNIAFSTRFYVDEGEIIDVLETGNAYRERLRDLIQMGREEEWVVIDLRPMVKGHFYRPTTYRFNEHIEDLVKRYDLLIIPKWESDPTPIYNE